MMHLSRLPSPVIFRGEDRTAYRDPAAVYADGVFHLFFTLVETEADGSVYMYLAKSRSCDLLNWDAPRKLTPRDQRLNYSSPGCIVRHREKWVICFQTYCRENGEKYGNANSRLYTMTTDDLEHFSEPRLLRVKGDIPEADMGRMIDPYLLQDAQEPDKWWCFYKQNGVSMSMSYDLENWTYCGSAQSGENVCVVRQDGMYYMLHSPQNGIGLMTSGDCVNWNDTGILLTLDQQRWTWAQGRITAGFAMDCPSQFDKEARWLMFFHGSGPEDERTMFDRYASIGIAWSNDLINWDWPGK